jgi:phage FluMu gp28-like protein
MAEETLFIEKSRTVMATWWAVAECLHYVMTMKGSCIFWCPDQDRAEKCIEYSKMLWLQQDDRLKDLYPLPKKKSKVEDQSVFRFELAHGGWLEALPGKNPDKIRSEHPSIVCMDEVAFNAAASQAYNNAQGARPKKLLAFSSAKPGWFFDTIRCAVPEEIKDFA